MGVANHLLTGMILQVTLTSSGLFFPSIPGESIKWDEIVLTKHRLMKKQISRICMYKNNFVCILYIYVYWYKIRYKIIYICIATYNPRLHGHIVTAEIW